MKELLNAIHGNFSIIITKKDGTFSDESANYRTGMETSEALKGFSKKDEIAERTDLAIECITSEDESYSVKGEYKTRNYLLIALKEI